MLRYVCAYAAIAAESQEPRTCGEGTDAAGASWSCCPLPFRQCCCACRKLRAACPHILTLPEAKCLQPWRPDTSNILPIPCDSHTASALSCCPVPHTASGQSQQCTVYTKPTTITFVCAFAAAVITRSSGNWQDNKAADDHSGKVSRPAAFDTA